MHFPGIPVVKNTPCNAWDAGLIPSQWPKISNATGQPSPHAPTRESSHCNERSHMIQLRPDATNS